MRNFILLRFIYLRISLIVAYGLKDWIPVNTTINYAKFFLLLKFFLRTIQSPAILEVLQ